MTMITFFSFKGGSGRSTGLCNVAYSLAHEGNRVGIIDFDIEGAGLNYVFDVPNDLLDDKKKVHDWLRPREKSKIHDTTELAIDFKNDIDKYGKKPWGEYPPEGEMYFIAASQSMEETSQIDFAESLKPIINELFDNFQSDYDLDYLLVDARSGFGSLSAPAFFQADKIAVFFRWSRQHRRGTTEAISQIHQSTVGAELTAVASAVPIGAPKADSEEKITEEYVEEWVSKYLEKDINSHCIVHESDLLKVDEQIITTPGHKESDTEAAKGYRELAEMLAE